MNLPLAGQLIVVTRTRSQASRLVQELQARGADTVEVPTIAIDAPSDGGEVLGQAIEQVKMFDWIVLTSPNGAERFCAALGSRSVGQAQIAVVGPATGRTVSAHGLKVDLVPERFVGEGLVEAFSQAPSSGGSVLLAQAQLARPVVADGLAALGWDVTAVPAYKTVPAQIDPEMLEGVADATMVTFTSSSTVEHFVQLVGVDRVPPTVACIGPITAETAQSLGLAAHIVATEHTIDGLVQAIVVAFSPEKHPG